MRPSPTQQEQVASRRSILRYDRCLMLHRLVLHRLLLHRIGLHGLLLLLPPGVRRAVQRIKWVKGTWRVRNRTGDRAHGTAVSLPLALLAIPPGPQGGPGRHRLATPLGWSDFRAHRTSPTGFSVPE